MIILEENDILLISKDEASVMRKQFGNYVVRQSHTKHPKYYLIENQKYLEYLEGYRIQRTGG